MTKKFVNLKNSTLNSWQLLTLRLKEKSEDTMKHHRIILLFALTLTYGLWCGNTFSQVNWIKYSGDPVLPAGMYVEFDYLQAKQPSVLFDEGLFKIWYVGKNKTNEQIGYAESQDGIHWIKKGPVLPLGQGGGFDAIHQNTPMVLKIGSTYHMWYGGYDGMHWSLGEAISSDGMTWEKKGVILDRGEPGEFDSHSVLSPYVMYRDYIYYLWYGGFDGCNWRIGFAKSYNGHSWVKEGVVLNIGPQEKFDSQFITHPEVYFDNRTFWMWYAGYDGRGWSLGYCISENGMVWHKQGIAFHIGSLHEFDNFHIGDASIIFNGKEYLLWYSGANESRYWQIGLAKAKPIPTLSKTFPQIISIKDVPNDQGQQVRISWLRSIDDSYNAPDSLLVTQYTIWRRIDPYTFHKSNQMTLGNDTSPGEWECVAAIPAVQDSVYHCIAPTLADFSVYRGIYFSIFFIRAHTNDPRVHWASPPDSGYSIDNIAPQPPSAIKAVRMENAILLQWEKPIDNDIDYFAIYRSTESGFTPSEKNRIGFTAETTYRDWDIIEGQSYYYLLATFDFAGNRSTYSEEVTITDPSSTNEIILEKIPQQYELFQNYPNPFNLATRIHYSLPREDHVRILIYDLLGKKITTLIDERQQAGYYVITWDGRDNSGRLVSSGIYLYRLEAKCFTQVREMSFAK